MKKVKITRVNNLEDLVKTVEDLTDRNYHIEARIEIARYFGFKDYEKVFRLINQISGILHGAPMSLLRFRDELTDDMLKDIKSREGRDVYEMIYRAL